MSRAGMTHEPCHGCGATVEHGKKALCNQCHEKMQAGERFIAAQRINTTKRPYRMNDEAPFIPYGGTSTAGSTWSRAARQIFTTLINALGETPATYDPGDHDSAYLFPPDDRIKHYEPIWHRILLMEPEHAAAIHEFYVLLYLLIRESYEQGKNDGAHLLNRLAEGDITVARFNELTRNTNVT